MKVIAAIAAATLFTGCAGHTSYVPPATKSQSQNSKIIDKPRSAVWASSIPALGSQFFTINNMDKESGFINISYSGDPESYIDCGTITSYVKNMRGERNYVFPGAKASQGYEIMNNGNLFMVNRTMALEGRVNLTFEELSPNQTKITANTRYVVTRNQVISNMEGRSQNFSNTISFNTGGRADFPISSGQTPSCIANGKLEQAILANVK